MQSDTVRRSIDRLNECLKSEMTAVDSYALALDRVDQPEIARTLREIRDNHQLRRSLISTFMRTRGAEPVSDAGLEGRFAKLLQRGADLLGDKTAVGALESLEERCLRMYAGAVGQTEWGETLRFIETDLLPKQRRTRDLCRTLKEFVA